MMHPVPDPHGMGGGQHLQVHHTQQQGQQPHQQQQQWVVVQGHHPHPAAGLHPQHQPVSVAVVCDGMSQLHAQAMQPPLQALYAPQQYVQPTLAGSMAGRTGTPPGAAVGGMQRFAAAPPGAGYMAAATQHMQQPGGAQRYGQALWSDVPGMQQRGRAAMGHPHPMMMQAAGPPAVTKGSTVEEILQVVRHMPRGASVVDAVRDSLQYLDSRALAALLKELSKTGLRDMAFHIFNWLREPTQSMDPAYGGLLDVFTYTTMIAQCTSPMHLDTALALMEEMRSRNIQPNTHTYSSLLNVCVKAGQLNMALGVYNEMLAAGLQPNLVTYNTLLEVYAKRGMWREAVGVLDTLEQQRLVPEPRTFNIVMNACNAAGQYGDCIGVHERMLNQNVSPTVGTCNAVLLAYCKLDRLAAAQQLFHEMRQKGCHPTHTTFIMLLQSAEVHGQAAVAVALLEQMQLMQLCLTPQCYAAAIGACAAAGQLTTARKLLADMTSSSKAGMAAPAHIIMQLQDKCCDWTAAYGTYQKLIASGVRPDRQTTATAIDALWGAGHVGSCLLAFKVFHAACTQGLFKADASVHSNEPVIEFLVPGAGACMAIVGLWTLLVEMRVKVLREGPTFLCNHVLLLLGDGQAQMPQLQSALSQLCLAPGVPFTLDSSSSSNSQAVLSVPTKDLVAWLLGPSYAATCPLVPSVKELEALKPQAVLDAERSDMAPLQQKIAHCINREASYVCKSKSMPAAYMGARVSAWGQVQAASKALQPASAGLPYTAMFLLDQAAAAGLLTPPAAAASSPGGTVQPVWAAAALLVGAECGSRQAGSACTPSSPVPGLALATSPRAGAAAAIACALNTAAVAAHFEVSSDALQAAAVTLREACAAACTTPVTVHSVLELFLQVLSAGRLDYQVSDQSLVGTAQSLAVQAVAQPVSLDMPASHLAGALVTAGREAAGLYPTWPKCLMVLTGLLNPQDAAPAQQLLTDLAAAEGASA